MGNFLLLCDELPESINDSDIFVLNTDQALRLKAQALEQGCEIRVLSVEAETRDEFIRDAEFERARYEKYIPILSSKFRLIHNIDEKDLFWERVLGITLLIHISQCRRIYHAYQLIRDMSINIVKNKSFMTDIDHISTNEVEHRKFFQYGYKGDVQLMHVCVSREVNCPNSGSEYFPKSDLLDVKESSAVFKITSMLKFIVSLIKYRSLLFQEIIVRFLKKCIKPRVIVSGVFWEHRHRQRVELASLGQVQVLSSNLNISKKKIEIDWGARALLSKPPHDTDADDFDNFFFSSLFRGAPTTWLEKFPERLISSNLFFNSLPHATNFINETLDEDNLLLMAVAAKRNITVIHIEHNYLQQQYVGNIIWYIHRKVDKYLSLGWSNASFEKVVGGGSYFNWIDGRQAKRKTISILYVSDFGMIKYPFCSSGYGESGSPNVKRFIEQKMNFFNSLSVSVKKEIYYRDYPKERRDALSVHYLDDKFCEEYFKQFGTVDSDGKIATTTLLNCCRVLVVDYLSTPYLQGLLADIPMVVLFNSDSYYLNDDYEEFFNDLISVGIFQTDPIVAANFLTSIMANPEAWWQSSSVKAARCRFLGRNFVSQDTLDGLLLSLVN
jgi:putative transferase (TIGR04331 family)